MPVSKKLVIFLVLSVLGISFTFYAYQVVFTPNILVGKDARELIIERGATFKSIQKQLHEGRYVNDLLSFSLLTRRMKYDRAIKTGRYVLTPGMYNMQAIGLLRSGNQVPVNVRLHHIRTLDELPENITANLMMSPAEFDTALAQFIKTNTEGFT